MILSITIEGPLTNEDGKLVLIFVICGERIEFEIIGYDKRGKVILKNIKDDKNKII